MHKNDQQSVNNILLEEAMPAIRAIAREVHQMHGPMRNLIPYGDLVSEGIVGALQAASYYDPKQGSFLRFARPRIRGRMTDMHRRRELKENSMLRNRISLDGSAAAKEQSFIDRHNADPKPFRWTKSADDILASIERFCRYNAPVKHDPMSRTSGSGH